MRPMVRGPTIAPDGQAYDGSAQASSLRPGITSILDAPWRPTPVRTRRSARTA